MSKRIEDISQCDYSRVNRNSIARNLFRIASPIPPLVMRESDFLGHSKLRNIASSKQFGTNHRVGAHEMTFRLLQLLRCEKDAIRHSNLSDVVKASSKINR